MTEYLHDPNLQRTAPVSNADGRSLRERVFENLITYFNHVDPKMPPRQLYALVMEEIEPPLLEIVMKYAGHNQCRAAEILGISRAHLRKKLLQFGYLKKSRVSNA